MVNGGDCPKKRRRNLGEPILTNKSISFQNSTNMILTMAMKSYSNVYEAGGTYEEEDPFACKREVLDEEDDNYESQMCKVVAKMLSPKKGRL